jgi:hypothetical protein
MLTVDPISLTVALGAVVVSVFIYLETRKQRKLTEVMVSSLAFLQKRSKPRTPRAGKSDGPTPNPPTPVVAQPPNSSAPKLALAPDLTPRLPSPAEQARLALAARREERKRLELELRQQREQWKRQKEVAKAIGWVLDRIGSDDDDEYED